MRSAEPRVRNRCNVCIVIKRQPLVRNAYKWLFTYFPEYAMIKAKMRNARKRMLVFIIGGVVLVAVIIAVVASVAGAVAGVVDEESEE